MTKPIIIKNIIKKYNKTIYVEGDKSLSIRFALLAAQAIGKSKAYGILKSEDVLSSLNCLKKLGVKVKIGKKNCEIFGNGINSFIYKDNLVLNAGNSGTTARLIASVLVNSPKTIKIVGDASLKKRDMKRVIEPLQEFGVKFKKNRGTLPLYINGSKFLRPINYQELRGSAQCKSAVMFAALSVPGITTLKCKPSRDHTEILYKNVLKLPIEVKKTNNFDYIKINGKKNFRGFSYKIPGDISSAAFFIVLTLLSKKSKLIIKNVNVNPTRIGIISILNKMGASIKMKNKKIYKGEKIADIIVKSTNNLKAINCPKNFKNSSAIDEFLLIFICSAFAKGISTFRGLEELNKKESKRLNWSFKILKMIGIKTQKICNSGIKIWGNPHLALNKKYVIKNYLKDHRITMCSIVLALSKGGNWKIYDPDSIKTSFPSFLNKINKLGGSLN